MVVLLFALNVQAQMELPDLSRVKVQLATDTINFTSENQVFIYGQDSIILETNCSSEGHAFASSKQDAQIGAVKVVDSIDLNEDSANELILYREWSCSTPGDPFNEFGVGSTSESNGQYEVWDVKNKRKLIEFKSDYSFQRILSTNVVDGWSYSYDVTIDKNGAIHFQKKSGRIEDEMVEGTYKFDRKIGEYVLK